MIDPIESFQNKVLDFGNREEGHHCLFQQPPCLKRTVLKKIAVETVLGITEIMEVAFVEPSAGCHGCWSVDGVA